MAYRLPILTVAAVVISSAFALAQSPPAGQGTANETAGQQLLAAAARQVATPALSAKVLHQVKLLGQKLDGATGHYQQLGGGSAMARLELKLAVDDQVSSLLQVCDGRFLYVRREMPENKSLTRVDLQQVHAAIGAEQAAPSGAGSSNWMALGGISRLLQTLEQNFEFSAPRKSSLSKTPVWLLEGKWRPERLALLLPSQSESILAGADADLNELPPQLPTSVVVVLGRDEVFPLFPYRVEFRRQAEGAGQGESIVTLQFYQVRRRGDLTAQHFEYKPGDQELIDVTAAFIHKLQLQPNK